MPMRTRVGTLAALAVTGLALGATLATPAEAAPKAPGFLAAADLPPHPSSSWTAGKVTRGAGEEGLGVCAKTDVPARSSAWHRDFRTELETGARQVTVVLPDTASAKSLVTRLNRDFTSCAARIEKADPETEATGKDYGKLSVEEGAHVYGLHTESSWGALDVNLMSVGRDGRTVTVVDWGQMGRLSDAPVKAFQKTTVTAVNKLH
ncbi:MULTISPECIES: hypothetical protein [unclassified Streptomyces]|uniref:hypothetical protein n=1 Tax=unclassified Streptomyces TaxID=2593676 RepID=UPI002476EF64|nr:MULTISPECIES: hypothetical protein [unclassified Streptomyces]MDH6453822.1 hypothetical protein [Streptomyces sp. SAI-119]MDH6495620.1 hypothetical protein [Streptomyces sp. SAI-149]